MAIHIGRRELLVTLGGGAAWPLAARAQQSAMPVIGFLNTRAREEAGDVLAAFRQGLKEAGTVEGRNVSIEYRWAERQYDRLPALAADLVHRRVVVIAANGPATIAAKAATTTIPIVFYTSGDPVALGLVASLARPDGNLTGWTTLGTELGSKRLELLREVAPTASTIAALVNPNNPLAESESSVVKAAAHTLGLPIHILHASTDDELDTAFATLVQRRVGALLISPDPFFSSRRERLGGLTLLHTVPAIYQYREFVAAGGLMSYGISDMDGYRSVGLYTARILRGKKPTELPVQQVTKVELIINTKTAKALGIMVPLPLLGRADEIIE
jgi:putative tryptophan/tyrosine transport system substrate-binding protein